ncbi:MAG: lnt [Pedosphaera sp.]|nr:lnt [Pedosphaera sp.]
MTCLKIVAADVRRRRTSQILPRNPPPYVGGYGNSAVLRHSLMALALVFFTNSAFAHDPSKSYLSLTLDSNQLTGQWDIPLRDLQTVVPLDPDKEGLVSWEKLNVRYRDITAYALAHLKITADGQPAMLRMTSTEPTVEEFADGPYLQLAFDVENSSGQEVTATATSTSELSNRAASPSLSSGERAGVRASVNTHFSAILPPPKTLELDYQLFFETNSLHRGLLRLEANGRTQSAVFTPERRAQKFALASSNPGHQFLVFLREGVWHIWTGYDHILFLLALLLPSVLQREGGRWRGVGALRPAFINVLKIVTAFTVAHSLTLTLATLEIVKLPSRLTESAIAASVVLAASNNLWPLIRERGWMVAFGFGLIHGFGFATALSDLGLVHGALVLTLVGFNLGVELGQLAIVALFLPVAFGLRGTWFYQTPLLRFGSAGIVLIAGVWLAERILNLKFLAF